MSYIKGNHRRVPRYGQTQLVAGRRWRGNEPLEGWFEDLFGGGSGGVAPAPTPGGIPTTTPPGAAASGQAGFYSIKPTGGASSSSGSDASWWDKVTGAVGDAFKGALSFYGAQKVAEGQAAAYAQQVQQAQTPTWVLPAAIGGGALLLVLALRK